MKKIRITSVSVRANRSLEATSTSYAQDRVRKFNHVHIEASASVGAGEDPSEVLNALKDFVGSELAKAVTTADITVEKRGWLS